MGNDGVAGELQASKPILMVIAGFTAIAWYNVAELNVMIWLRFKRHRGLYFWSLLVASWGVAVHALGMIGRFFEIWKHETVSVVVTVLGWYCMVTGQSLVLYSRLHLIMRDNRKVKWVLYMIIVDGIILHGVITVFVFMANSPLASRVVYPYSIAEKFQVTAFTVQETIISGLYIYYTYKMILPGAIFPKINYRKVMLHLIRVNILIIILDFSLLGSEFANHYEIQTTYKSACYSIKLKLEFAILNQLIALTRSNVNSLNNHSSGLTRGRSQPRMEPRPNCRGDLWPGIGPQGIEPPCRTYIVSASTSSPSSRAKIHHDDAVMRTIDVEVTVSEPQSRASTLSKNFDAVDFGEKSLEKSKGAEIMVLDSPPESTRMEFLTGNSYLTSVENSLEKGKGVALTVSSSSSPQESPGMEFITGSSYLTPIDEAPRPDPIDMV